MALTHTRSSRFLCNRNIPRQISRRRRHAHWAVIYTTHDALSPTTLHTLTLAGSASALAANVHFWHSSGTVPTETNSPRRGRVAAAVVLALPLWRQQPLPTDIGPALPPAPSPPPPKVRLTFNRNDGHAPLRRERRPRPPSRRKSAGRGRHILRAADPSASQAAVCHRDNRDLCAPSFLYYTLLHTIRNEKKCNL